MRLIKVVVADDSLFLRTVLIKELESTDELVVVGVAKNGKEALELVETKHPDILILDCEMPVMDGIECLQQVKKKYTIPVFMLSALTYAGAGITIKALDCGAADFLQKPTAGGVGLSEIREVLLAKIKAVIRKNRFSQFKKTDTAVSGQKKSADIGKLASKKIDLIVLGSSTGGVQASREVLIKLPVDMPPIVWVQHMPENFTKSLAERLDSLCKIHVKEAEDGDLLQRGTCYLAPGGRQMEVSKRGHNFYIKLGGTDKVSGHCPSCDVLFTSVVKYFSNNVLGVILTGMGADGSKGLKQMHDKGAFVIGQDEESCVVYGMPKVAYKLGAVDIELDVKEIAKGMMEIIK